MVTVSTVVALSLDQRVLTHRARLQVRTHEETKREQTREINKGVCGVSSHFQLPLHLCLLTLPIIYPHICTCTRGNLTYKPTYNQPLQKLHSQLCAALTRSNTLCCHCLFPACTSDINANSPSLSPPLSSSLSLSLLLSLSVSPLSLLTITSSG